MARIRHTRPAIWTDRQLCRLSLGAHFIAVALPNYCDDEGRWEFSPRLVLAEIFPYRPEISEADVAGWPEQFMHTGYVRRYEALEATSTSTGASRRPRFTVPCGRD